MFIFFFFHFFTNCLFSSPAMILDCFNHQKMSPNNQMCCLGPRYFFLFCFFNSNQLYLLGCQLQPTASQQTPPATHFDAMKANADPQQLNNSQPSPTKLNEGPQSPLQPNEAQQSPIMANNGQQSPKKAHKAQQWPMKPNKAQ